jgi:hypothetical protein
MRKRTVELQHRLVETVMRLPAITALGVLASLNACAPTADTAGVGGDGTSQAARQCFSVSQVTNFRQGGAAQVFLRVGRNDVYELNSAGGCRDLDFANRLAITPDFSGSVGSRLCTGDSARVIVPGSASPSSFCRVRITRKLTAEEIAALPGAHRP